MNKKLILGMAGALLFTQAQAYQHNGKFDIGKMSTEANLVFRGTVIAVNYRGSEATERQRSLPHTFVTFQVDEVLQGKGNRKHFTLRFLGGKTDKGEIMMSSDTPKFDVGDQDLVFVKNNGVSECPLVDCAKGRFRIFNGRVYTEDGRRVVEDESGKVRAGQRDDLEPLTSFRIGEQQFSRRHMRSGPKNSEADAILPDQSSAYHVEERYFTNLVRTSVAKTMQKPTKSMREIAQSQDKNRPFLAVQGKPVALPEPKHAVDPAAEMSEQERAEVKAMQESGGNPVLK